MPVRHIITTTEGIKTASEISIQSGFFFCGALTLLSFFILLVFIKSRERIYLYYFLFLLFSLLEAVFFLGLTPFISTLFPIPIYAAGNLKELVTLLAYSAYCFFTIYLLNIKQQNKKLYYWILLMAVGGTLYGIAYCILVPNVLQNQVLAFTISRLVILFMSIVAIVWLFIKKIKSNVIGYFLTGSAFYFIGALFALLRDSVSTLPIAPFYIYDAETYFQWGIFLEVICFTMALSVQLYAKYEEKQKSQLKRNALAIYEKEVAQSEALALKIQVNPHFLFNYLNVLKYYIQINENKKAIHYLVSFSKFIREILDFNQKKTITLQQELKLVEHYLRLEEIRFNQNFTFHLDIDERINPSEIKIPPMILQPFMEEILWTGMQDSKKPREIRIAIHSSAESTIIAIEEKKILHYQSKEKREQKRINKAINQQITEDRIALYNKNYENKEKITFIIVDEKDLRKTDKQSQTIIKIENSETS